MKTRNGFVSNSSSTSFVIDKSTVESRELNTEKLVDAIYKFSSALKTLSDNLGKYDVPSAFDIYNPDNWMTVDTLPDGSIQLIFDGEAGCDGRVLSFVRSMLSPEEEFIS